MVKEVPKSIRQRNRFVLTSRAVRWGAIGSVLACCQILRAMGTNAPAVAPWKVPCPCNCLSSFPSP